MSLAREESGTDRGPPGGPPRRLAWRFALPLATAAAIAALVFAEGPLEWVAAGAVVALTVGLAFAGERARVRVATPLVQVPRRRATFDGRVAQLLAALPDPCLITNAKGIVLMHNEKVKAVLPGLRSGDPFTFVLRAPEVVRAFRSVAGGGSAEIVAHEERVPVERSFSVHMTPLRIDPDTAAGEPDHIVVTLQETTERAALERMRMDFVANASHELRTPLASLAGFIETLQGPARNDAQARERFLAIMRDQAGRMSRLIDDLLSLSRIEMNSHLRPETIVDLRPILARTADALAPVARENGVIVALEMPEDPLEVRGDADDLVRMFENLIENGIKYGAEGKTVDAKLSRDPDTGAALISVRDRGPGIREGDIPRLTERFYRVDTDASRKKGGTGLGLAIVKHIVIRHGGRLTIDSKLGEGATFQVRLPAAQKATDGG
jgi:two-component system phosphate regulon sensor histidine kinase PhoR